MAGSAACMRSWPRLMQFFSSSVAWTKLEAETTFQTKTLQGIESTKQNGMTHGIWRWRKGCLSLLRYVFATWILEENSDHELDYGFRCCGTTSAEKLNRIIFPMTVVIRSNRMLGHWCWLAFFFFPFFFSFPFFFPFFFRRAIEMGIKIS